MSEPYLIGAVRLVGGPLPGCGLPLVTAGPPGCSACCCCCDRWSRAESLCRLARSDSSSLIVLSEASARPSSSLRKVETR